MSDATTVPVTVRMPAERRDALDGLARALQRDRSYLVNEAVAQFIEQQAGWAAHLREGLRQAGAGELATAEEVTAAFAAGAAAAGPA
jgi:RHH-type transcriptional regulator, rel operon repressor / antitoxin RelB